MSATQHDPIAPKGDARYPLLTADEQVALSPDDLRRYQAWRRAFDDEVEQHKEHIARHGWLNVAKPGKPDNRYYVRRSSK